MTILVCIEDGGGRFLWIIFRNHLLIRQYFFVGREGGCGGSFVISTMFGYLKRFW